MLFIALVIHSQRGIVITALLTSCQDVPTGCFRVGAGRVSETHPRLHPRDAAPARHVDGVSECVLLSACF